MWLSKRGGSISKFIGTSINVDLRNRSKLGNDTRINIDLKIKTEAQSCGSGSHSCSRLISLKWKLVNLSTGWYWSSSSLCDEIDSWLKSSRHHDSWFSSILLAQRPFTLVLMMINSCSYYLLIILWYLVSDIWSR